MATTINEEKTITLVDGTKISARPLKISLLRQFLKKFDEIAEVADNNDKSMDILMQCVVIALTQYNPTLAAKEISELEDVLDLPVVYEIVEIASGIKLGESALLNSIN
jgi:hypothetical protein